MNVNQRNPQHEAKCVRRGMDGSIKQKWNKNNKCLMCLLASGEDSFLIVWYAFGQCGIVQQRYDSACNQDNVVDNNKLVSAGPRSGSAMRTVLIITQTKIEDRTVAIGWRME